MMRSGFYYDAMVVALVAGIAGCSQPATGPDPGVGMEPKLPPPQATLLPTVKIATAKGWPEGLIWSHSGAD